MEVRKVILMRNLKIIIDENQVGRIENNYDLQKEKKEKRKNNENSIILKLAYWFEKWEGEPIEIQTIKQMFNIKSSYWKKILREDDFIKEIINKENIIRFRSGNKNFFRKNK